MARYVLDAPTLLHIVADEVPVSDAHKLVAPNLVRSQVLDLLLARVRAGELTDRAAMALHTRVTERPVRLLGDRMSRRTAFTIAREQGWAHTYDAEYLAVTKLQADALITIDETLAAKARGIVPLADVSALGAE